MRKKSVTAQWKEQEIPAYTRVKRYELVFNYRNGIT